MQPDNRITSTKLLNYNHTEITNSLAYCLVLRFCNMVHGQIKLILQKLFSMVIFTIT